jgi:hypothetical protein
MLASGVFDLFRKLFLAVVFSFLLVVYFILSVFLVIFRVPLPQIDLGEK